MTAEMEKIDAHRATLQKMMWRGTIFASNTPATLIYEHRRGPGIWGFHLASGGTL